MTNYELAMLGIQIGVVCNANAKVDTAVDGLVAIGILTAAEATKVRQIGKGTVAAIGRNSG